MKVSGFTFVKNAIKYGYPLVESVLSVLPMVDEFIICLGDSEDDTAALVASIQSEKIKVIHSVWDDNLREGGRVLAVETDKAMDATAPDSDWLFYIQADEVIHEKYHPVLLQAMAQCKDDRKVEGLLLHYHHFYGSFKYLGDGRTWYAHEIRVIRNDKRIRSYRDAQGFRWNDNRKLNVKLVNAWMYHYGWVRSPLTMQLKQRNLGSFFTGKKVDEQEPVQQFDYSRIDSLVLFEGTHPAVMKNWVSKEDWSFDIDPKRKNFKNIKHRVLYFLAKRFGWRPFSYKNYKLI